MSSCKFAAYFQNTFSYEHFQMAASVKFQIAQYSCGNCEKSVPQHHIVMAGDKGKLYECMLKVTK